MRLRNLVAPRCRNRQPERFYGYEKAYTFSTLRKLRGSICKGILIRTHHLLQDFCTNSYELLIHFDAHNLADSRAKRCASMRNKSLLRVTQKARFPKPWKRTFTKLFCWISRFQRLWSSAYILDASLGGAPPSKTIKARNNNRKPRNFNEVPRLIVEMGGTDIIRWKTGVFGDRN